MTAVGVLRASGFLDFLGEALTAPAAFLHIPPPLVPLLIVRLISNSAATGLLLDLFREFGTDSFTGISASILMSCTETVFYCLSVYFGLHKRHQNQIHLGRGHDRHRRGGRLPPFSWLPCE